MTSLFKVISQTEPVTINTKNGPTQKTILVLKEFGTQYADSYVCSLIGEQQPIAANSLVWACLHFAAREYNGSNYQDITITDIVTFNKQ